MSLHRYSSTLTILSLVFVGLVSLARSLPTQLQAEAAGVARPWQPTLQSTHQVFLPILLSSSRFQETFDGNPSSPTRWRPRNWDVVTHIRANRAYFEPAMQADHGPDCGAPPAGHLVEQLTDAVFQCRNHVMTAVNAPDYGMIYLTPNQQVDFSGGEAVIRWEMSTVRSSNRDWVDVWITPYADNLALPVQAFIPDGNGAPRRAIHVTMELGNIDTFFRAHRIENFALENLPMNGAAPKLAQFLAPSATRRDTFELRISRTHITFGMPAYNVWWVDTAMAPLDWSQGVVTLGHHSYNPTKDGGTPSTWHWDNVTIEPAVPFTISSADRSIITAADAGTPVRFAQPAPPGAHLRFSGLLGSEVSFDGGRSWQAAQRQAQGETQTYHFQSYWTPIPAGTQEVRFRGDPNFPGGWMVRDPSIWAAPAT